VSLDVDRRRRDPDDLDDLIDELLPDVDDPPGWFDVGLIGVGAGLLLWVAIGSPPTIVLPAGIVALSLGCILPARTAWRRVRQGRQRRRRAAVLSTGVPLDVSSPVSRRLVQAYEDVLRAARGRDIGSTALAAAHTALLESASLLNGRAPASARETSYLEARAGAVEALAAALQELPRTDPAIVDSTTPTVDSGALIEARDELDRITGSNSVSQLEQITHELETQQRDDD
jgi:hypothetical protein